MRDSIRVTTHLDGPYVVAGNRAYLIGQMDGTFPSYGDHIPGEMAGLWRHPNKLLREIRLGWADPGMPAQQLQAEAFVRHPWAVEHHYGLREQLRLTRTFWVPDDEPGVVMTLAVENRGAQEARLDLIVDWVSDLHPGWLDARPRGFDTLETDPAGFLFRNSASPWWVSCVADAPGETRRCLPTETGKWPPECAAATTVHRLIVPGGDTVRLTYWICGGDGSPPPLAFPEDVPQWRADKESRYAELVNTAAVTVPDSELQHALEWMKPQADWLMRSVPGIGTGLGAGVPEYPWWFGCDSHYTVKGVLAFGQHGWAQSTLNLLRDVSQKTNGDGRIIHEVSTTGVVYNPGNAQEAPQFVDAVWETFCWSGDVDWLRSQYPAVEAAMQWVLGQDASGRDLAPGYGIIEIEALNLRMVDTAVYTYAGLRAYAAMAEVLGDPELGRGLNDRAERLKARIASLFWMDDEGLFADFLAAPEAVEERIDLWVQRAQQRGQPDAAGRYRRLPFALRDCGEAAYLMKNWIINTPMEMGVASEAQAQRALSLMRQSMAFHGPFGLYLSGTEQREMMTISTGVQAVAEIRYGNADAALAWMRDIAQTMDMRSPGTISEMSPDYGCFVQAWTAYGLWYPLVTGFFGIRPRAWLRELAFQPVMPSGWDQASLRRVRMGTNAIDCQYVREDGKEQYRITTEEPWDIIVGPDLALDAIGAGDLINGTRVRLKAGGWAQFHKTTAGAGGR